MTPKEWYQGMRASPDFIEDPTQSDVIEKLEELWQQLVEFKARRNQFLGHSLLNPAVPKGLYLWGGVGRGKTLLMDAFYQCVPFQRKRRQHFHHFMAEVHHDMKQLEHDKDSLISIAERITKSTRLLCLDEFHVDDIANAMILARLLGALFERGLILITTSNYPPEGLYPDGLQRQNFLPAINLLQQSMTVIHINNGQDFRLQKTVREPVFLVPANDTHETQMNMLFLKIALKTSQDVSCIEVHGRNLPIKKIAKHIVWFEFNALCRGSFSQEDYLEIAHRFHTVFLSHIPYFNAEKAAEARRFTWLIDVFYDNHVRLIASSEGLPSGLDSEGAMPDEFCRTISRLTEMQTQHYLLRPHHSQNEAHYR